MAKTTRTVTEMTDDIDGGDAEETVSFSLDGAAYEIDLNEKNAALLREAFAPYVGHGRKAAGPRRAPTAARSIRTRGAAPGGEGRTSQIRAWARENGVTVNERGRLSAEVVSQYEAAH